MIGVLDSGLGGLSVWQELIKLMPDEEYVYVADSGHCPYGPKPPSEIYLRTERISRYLIGQGARIIVVACNTATAAAIGKLRSAFTVPFVGMEPAVKPAALNTRTGVIGVLATQGTLRGELYLRTLHRFAAGTRVIERIGEGLVELVENGLADTPQAEALMRKYIGPMLEAGADHLVLGCTHYPFLSGVIEKIAGDRMTLVNPAPAVARRTREILKQQVADNEKKCLKEEKSSCSGGKKTNKFVTTGHNLPLMRRMVCEILNKTKHLSDDTPGAFSMEDI